MDMGCDTSQRDRDCALVSYVALQGYNYTRYGALFVHLCGERMQYRTIVDCHNVKAPRYGSAQFTQQNFKDGHIFKDRGQYDHAG
jgi:hypothetical protein